MWELVYELPVTDGGSLRTAMEEMELESSL